MKYESKANKSIYAIRQRKRCCISRIMLLLEICHFSKLDCFLLFRNVFYNTIIALFTISNILFLFGQLKFQASVLQNIFTVSRALLCIQRVGLDTDSVLQSSEILFPSLSVRNA